MKRFHVHVAVHDLEKSIRFYKAMFDAEPTVKRADYAKWQLEDPRINFAISQRGAKTGVDHLGIQAENGAELDQSALAAGAGRRRDHGPEECHLLLREERQALDHRPAGHRLGIVPHARGRAALRGRHAHPGARDQGGLLRAAKFPE